jgi:hypothetical protein
MRIPTERERRFRAVKGNFADRHWLSIPTIVKGFHLPSESSDFRFRAVKGNSDDHESP